MSQKNMSTKLMSPGGIEQNLKTVKLKLFHVLRISSVRGIEPSKIEQHKCKAKAKSSDMSKSLCVQEESRDLKTRSSTQSGVKCTRTEIPNGTLKYDCNCRRGIPLTP